MKTEEEILIEKLSDPSYLKVVGKLVSLKAQGGTISYHLFFPYGRLERLVGPTAPLDLSKLVGGQVEVYLLPLGREDDIAYVFPAGWMVNLQAILKKARNIGAAKKDSKKQGNSSHTSKPKPNPTYCYLANPNLTPPTTDDPEKLFRFAVVTAIKKVCGNYHGKISPHQFQQHVQWTSLIFGEANAQNRARMSIITSQVP